MSAPLPYPGTELRLQHPRLVNQSVLAVQQRLATQGLACADLKGAAVARSARGLPRAT